MDGTSHHHCLRSVERNSPGEKRTRRIRGEFFEPPCSRDTVACLTAIIGTALLYPDGAPLARNDLLVVLAVLIQAGMLLDLRLVLVVAAVIV